MFFLGPKKSGRGSESVLAKRRPTSKKGNVIAICRNYFFGLFGVVWHGFPPFCRHVVLYKFVSCYEGEKVEDNVEHIGYCFHNIFHAAQLIFYAVEAYLFHFVGFLSRWLGVM